MPDTQKANFDSLLYLTTTLYYVSSFLLDFSYLYEEKWPIATRACVHGTGELQACQAWSGSKAHLVDRQRTGARITDRLRCCLLREEAKDLLFAEVLDDPGKQGQGDADHNTGDDREIDGGVFPAVGDVTGKASNRQAGATEEEDCAAGDDKHDTEDEDGAA